MKPSTTLLAGFLVAGITIASQAKPLTLNATVDFPDLSSGEAPYYKDGRHRALAINAGNRSLRDKWAKAETTFDGANGIYDITITTLTELDGESTYRLLVNGVEAGSFTNPASQKDYDPACHTWPGITIAKGDKLAVESKPHTNGKIPERGGTAWARGRWRDLRLAPSKQL